MYYQIFYIFTVNKRLIVYNSGTISAYKISLLELDSRYTLLVEKHQ